MSEVVHRTCHLCEAMCGLVVETQSDRIVEIRPDADDVFSRGHICPKAFALAELYTDPDRLRSPVRRTASGFVPVDWEEALSDIVSKLYAIQSEHGRSSIATYVGNPVAHNHEALLMGQLFARALGSKNRFDANSQDANPKLYASHAAYGELTSITIPDVDRTSFFLILGANPIASGGSVMSLGDVRGRMRGIRERGGRVVLVDPRRTETAPFADQHLAIRPGGDAALVLALLEVIFAEGLFDERSVRRTTRGLDALKAAAAPFTPERVASAIGLSSHAIRALARDFARAPSAVAYGRVGVCTNEFGAIASYLIEALNVVTGNFDKAGGAMFASPAIDLSALARRFGVGGAGRFRTRVRGLPEVGGMFPATAMAEEMETPGRGQIRGLVTMAGNPVLSVPGSERLDRALGKLDLMVSIDLYINETTRHAHYILPPRFGLERDHYDVLFHALAVRNTAKWSSRAVNAEASSLSEWTILYELATRLFVRRVGGVGLERWSSPMRRALEPSPKRVLDALIRFGPYGSGISPFGRGLTLAKIEQAPHGLDLGPLVPMRRARVSHVGGLVELGHVGLLSDAARVSQWLDAPRPPLVLIGRRHLRSNNSWMHNAPSLVSGKDRATLLMHPDDAAERGLQRGIRVHVSSAGGRVEAKLEVSDSFARGVVSLPHGFGHGLVQSTMRVAGAVLGPNANAVIDAGVVEPLTGTAVLNGVPVDVRALA